MKRIIITVWVLSLTLTIFAQGNKNLRDHQMPARIENLFRYAESLGYKRGEYYYNSQKSTSYKEEKTIECSIGLL